MFRKIKDNLYGAIVMACLAMFVVADLALVWITEVDIAYKTVISVFYLGLEIICWYFCGVNIAGIKAKLGGKDEKNED